MAKSVFGDPMESYQPGWEYEPSSPIDLTKSFRDRVSQHVDPDDYDYFPICMQIATMRAVHLGDDLPMLVERARFLVDFNRRKAEAWSKPSALPPAPTGSVVYYIRLRDLIKIGTTRRDPRRRRDAIQADEVLATEPGSYQHERARHQQFAHLRYRNELFYPGRDLLDHIAALGGRSDRQAEQPRQAHGRHRPDPVAR